MTLLNNILHWTETKLSAWQQDTARRLFQQEDGLSNDDYAEVYALLKAAHGLPNPLGLTPVPLKSSHLPTTLQDGETVILNSIRDLNHVNRIAPGQKLTFATSGMTVIYGGNGSGKSGYTRVMKRACRARDLVEKVHTDAHDTVAQNHVPEALFDIVINGSPKTVKWASGSDSPVELSSIAVFDSHCARSYLTAEHEVAYLPYGLDVVENLANTILPELKRRIDAEIAAINIDRQPFNHLLGDTKVGQLISSLNDKTNPTKVNDLGTISEIEVKRIEELDIALAVTDPSAKAKELRLSASRIKELVLRIESIFARVNDDAINKLKEMDDNTVVAGQLESQAAVALQSGEKLLPGTGGQTWKILFESARKFSTEIAYPNLDFPYITEGAACPLCQQSLNESGERLKRFDEYIKNDVAKAATQHRQNLETARKNVEGADINIGFDESLGEELAHLDEVIGSKIINFQKSMIDRRTWMLTSLESHVWNTIPALSENPRQRLRDLAASQLKSSRTFARAADETKKKNLTDERQELRSHQNLSVCRDAVLALIERMKMRKVLESCEKDLKTKPISDQSKVFANNAVTVKLKNALDDEFKALGIDHIKTKLKDRNDKGKIKHQLLLDLPTINKLEQILSEGEQRAIALGSFLAELKLANNSGGIVFDDPVSSLDHKRRGKVAKRLASESQNRQVFIFTHDVVFLHQLRDECNKQLNQSPVFCFLEANSGYFGHVSAGLPWDHKSYKERIDSLEKAQKKFEKLPWPTDPTEEQARAMIQQYSFLRATIERVVQDFVLNATVQRFRDYIEIKNLEKVVGLEQSEVDEIARQYQRCHDLVEAHDPSSAKDDPPPTADELDQDISALKTLIQVISNRRKGVTT